MTKDEKRLKEALAVDDLEGTYEFYMDHLADYETLLKEEPLRKNLSIAPKRKTTFLEDRNTDKKIVLPKKKLTLPLIPSQKIEQILGDQNKPKKQFLQRTVHQYGQLSTEQKVKLKDKGRNEKYIPNQLEMRQKLKSL